MPTSAPAWTPSSRTSRDLAARWPARTGKKGLALLRHDVREVFLHSMVGPYFGSSVDTAPFGTALPPMSGPVGRLRNRSLRFVMRRLIFGAHEREADRILTRRLGVPPLRRFVFEWFRAADEFLQFTVPEFEYPRGDLPDMVTFVGAAVPPHPGGFLPPEWWPELDSGRPVVLATQGTVDIEDYGRLVLPTVEGLADDDALVVATTGGPPVSRLGDLPANVRAESYVPYADLLPRADAMVTNGGYGGVQYALRHGVPLVVAGGTEGKPEVAARVAWPRRRTGWRPRPPAGSGSAAAGRAGRIGPRVVRLGNRAGGGCGVRRRRRREIRVWIRLGQRRVRIRDGRAGLGWRDGRAGVRRGDRHASTILAPWRVGKEVQSGAEGSIVWGTLNCTQCIVALSVITCPQPPRTTAAPPSRSGTAGPSSTPPRR